MTIVHRLSNGMLVLLREVHTAPVASCWVWYNVGSRNEGPGTTGISHWVEHMLFKGTPTLPKGSLDRLIPRNGGVFNAFTSNDFTAYYETLPADRIELALEIEADRMVNTIFDIDEVESERTVILAEREGAENEPDFWLNEAVMAAAYQIHPYRHEGIGWKHDLLSMTRDDLYRHYQRYYRPNNAVLVVVGDIDSEHLLAVIERLFGTLPMGEPPAPVTAVEPEQQGERRVTIRRPGPAQYVQIAYRAPACRDADFVPMLMLDAVLSGAKGMSFGGGAQTNRSARIYRALVETQIAAFAGSGFRAMIDPSLFELSATVHEGRTADEVEAALVAEVDRLRDELVSEAEMTKVHKQVRAQLAYSADSVTNQALMLGMWHLLDRHDRIETLTDELNAVTAEDVRRVAQRYLIDRHRTVGHFIPT